MKQFLEESWKILSESTAGDEREYLNKLHGGVIDDATKNPNSSAFMHMIAGHMEGSRKGVWGGRGTRISKENLDRICKLPLGQAHADLVHAHAHHGGVLDDEHIHMIASHPTSSHGRRVLAKVVSDGKIKVSEETQKAIDDGPKH